MTLLFAKNVSLSLFWAARHEAIDNHSLHVYLTVHRREHQILNRLALERTQGAGIGCPIAKLELNSSLQ
jgi:hypothetical protein